MINQTFSERCQEINLLMEYAVPKDSMPAALALLDKYSADPIALTLLKEFYSYLPEGLDDAITGLYSLCRRRGTFLICATTILDSYLYIVTAEKAEFLGRTGDGIWDEEVLTFFGYKDRDDFLKRHETIMDAEELAPTLQDQDLCPVCSVAEGEHHILGCPLELCPWCGSQLTICNCRFTQLNTASIKEEDKLDELLELLEQKGRIPYDPAAQRPSYLKDVQ